MPVTYHRFLKGDFVKALGTIVLIGAALVGGYALFVFDPSVATAGGGRVNNLGLMQDRQNILIASCAAAVVGCILMVFAGRPEQGASSTANGVRPGADGRSRAAEALEPEKLLAVENFRDALKRDDAVAVRKMLNDLTVRAYHERPTGRGFLQYAVVHECRELHSVAA